MFEEAGQMVVFATAELAALDVLVRVDQLVCPVAHWTAMGENQLATVKTALHATPTCTTDWLILRRIRR